MRPRYLMPILTGVALVSCSKGRQEPVVTPPRAAASLNFNQAFDGHDLDLAIVNHGSRAACLPRTEIEPSALGFLLQQNGASLAPQHEVDREVTMLNGTDVGEGLEVIPSGKKRHFFISMDDFDVKTGQFKASISFNLFDCRSLFSASPPTHQKLDASVSGSLSAR